MVGHGETINFIEFDHTIAQPQIALLRLSSNVGWDIVASDLNCFRASAYHDCVAR
jgi:hypothetical protein